VASGATTACSMPTTRSSRESGLTGY
jgi:hypothetical protein